MVFKTDRELHDLNAIESIVNEICNKYLNEQLNKETLFKIRHELNTRLPLEDRFMYVLAIDEHGTLSVLIEKKPKSEL